MVSLLSLLEDSNIRSTAQLAEALHATPELIEAQLERYAQLGYVKKTIMGGGCGGGCKTCKGCSGMCHEAPVVYWECTK